MVMNFVGRAVLVVGRFFVLFLPYKSYGAEVFCSHWNPNRVVLNSLNTEYALVAHICASL